MEAKLKDVNDLYRSERSKVESLEALVSQLKSGVSAQSVQARLIELTK
jgi:Ca2+-binding EF-hand superfamily protein